MDVSRRDFIKLGTTTAAAGGTLTAQAAQAHRGSARLYHPARPTRDPVRPAPGPLRRSPQHPRLQRRALAPRGAAAGDAGPHPLRPDAPRPRGWLRPGRLAPGQRAASSASGGPCRTALSANCARTAEWSRSGVTRLRHGNPQAQHTTSAEVGLDARGFISPQLPGSGDRRNRPRPSEDRQPPAVAIGHVNQARGRVLVRLPGVTAHPARSGVLGRKVVSDLARQVGIRNVPSTKPLIVPGLVEKAGRPEVEPRLMDRLLSERTHLLGLCAPFVLGGWKQTASAPLSHLGRSLACPAGLCLGGGRAAQTE